MSDLLKRLKALRGGDAVARAPAPASVPAPRPVPGAYDRPAAQLGARLVESDYGLHLLREAVQPADALHGEEPLGEPEMHPLLMRQAGASGDNGSARILYIDTETTGLAGGTGTFAFLIGAGFHNGEGFEVRQYFLPAPEHELSQLHAFARLARGAAAVVTYNGASFDLPLLRNRFALHGLPDPLSGVPHLDLLHVVRRLWKTSLPDCTLSTVERRVLRARRSLNDVPGFEVPARYLAYLRSRDAAGLRGVIEHNEVDIVALAALRSRIGRLIDQPTLARVSEAHGLAQLLERVGEHELALERYLEAARGSTQAAWHASLLLKRLDRLDEAAELWRKLGKQKIAAAWIELAKVQEHKWRDFEGALESVEAAAQCPGCDPAELVKRRERLERRIKLNALVKK